VKNEQKPQKLPDGNIEKLATEKSTQQAKQLEELQMKYTRERDARRADWFIAIVLLIIMFDVMFFSVMPSSGGPIALVILQLLFLIPLATRLGMQEIAKIIGRVLARTSKNSSGEGD